jgi:hypothetical protein
MVITMTVEPIKTLFERLCNRAMPAKSVDDYPLIQVEKILKNEKLIRELLFGKN